MSWCLHPHWLVHLLLPTGCLVSVLLLPSSVVSAPALTFLQASRPGLQLQLVVVVCMHDTVRTRDSIACWLCPRTGLSASCYLHPHWLLHLFLAHYVVMHGTGRIRRQHYLLAFACLSPGSFTLLPSTCSMHTRHLITLLACPEQLSHDSILHHACVAVLSIPATICLQSRMPHSLASAITKTAAVSQPTPHHRTDTTVSAV